MAINQALTELDFLAKRAALPLQKLIKSAVANAGVKAESLIIKNITVDKGITLKRSMPVARGSAHPIHKHTSRVIVTLGLAGETKKTSKKK